MSELGITTGEGESEVTIPYTISNAMAAKNEKSKLVISSAGSSYELPVSVVDGTRIAADLGVTSAELNLVVSMEKVNNETTGGLLSYAVDFKVKVQAPNGESADVTHLGYPVKRSIVTDLELDAASTVGVRVNEDGTVTPVPTYIDGDSTADLFFSSNSAYTLISHSKTFADIDNRGYWGEEFIEKLASKMIVNGKTDEKFSPSIAITRGEFAAVLARGLGLVAEDPNSDEFTDVSTKQGANKNGEIAAVVEAGIVQGYGNGQFGPYDEISRNEAAIMISRAMDFIGSDDIELNEAKKVADFADYRYISEAARPHVERVYQAEYLEGFPEDNTYRSQGDTSRAQTAKILYNFLNSIKFIN
ncbi:S-layer homology domain-containing protein [Planococcus salinus]|uniref:S-layer homology domain-containing protein n=2 Tax=Planococcus salinus TaxID=1848460 RepID=A0A3M8P7I0_9BACL|nr:S-layer homology domain-containing protein [Planococcus salinus]